MYFMCCIGFSTLEHKKKTLCNLIDNFKTKVFAQCLKFLLWRPMYCYEKAFFVMCSIQREKMQIYSCLGTMIFWGVSSLNACSTFVIQSNNYHSPCSVLKRNSTFFHKYIFECLQFVNCNNLGWVFNLRTTSSV